MNPLKAYPFKNMRTVVYLIEKGKVSVNEIRSSTGMCSFDSTEVSDMLSYLTSFGQVKLEKKGWTIQKPETDAVYDRIRKGFLKDAMTILEQLSDTGKSAAQLAQETGLSIDKVDSYLPFLAEITRLGIISRCSPAYPVSWCQKSK